MPRTYLLYRTASSVTLPKNAQGKAISLYSDVIERFINRRIHIHIGNYPQDSLGCILLGYKNANNGSILESTSANNDFYSIVESLGIDNFELIIKEIQ